MKKISVVVSAYNSKDFLDDCLKSVGSIADEIIVIDNSSTDNTIEIAKKYTDRVFTRENNLMLNINKNYGFSKAKNEWILNLDHDERVTKELEEEIISLPDNSSSNGYFIPRKNIIFGKWIRNSIWWPDYQLRLFKKQSGRFPEKHIHEYIEVEGEISKLNGSIEHQNYQTISQYIYKLEKVYTENEVENILSSGKKLNWHYALRMPIGDFLKTYFMQKGYKDGLHGLVLSLLQSFYSLVVFAKVWERQGFEEKNIPLSDVTFEMNNLGKEVRYWILTSAIEESKSKFKKTVNRIKRRISSKPFQVKK